MHVRRAVAATINDAVVQRGGAFFGGEPRLLGDVRQLSVAHGALEVSAFKGVDSADAIEAVCIWLRIIAGKLRGLDAQLLRCGDAVAKHEDARALSYFAPDGPPHL